MVLEAKLENHSTAAAEFRTETGQTLKEIKDQLAAGDTRFALLDDRLGTLVDSVVEMRDVVRDAAANGANERSKDRLRLEVLERDNNQRLGREGVWAAILRSPVGPWIATLGALIAAAFSWLKNGS